MVGIFAIISLVTYYFIVQETSVAKKGTIEDVVDVEEKNKTIDDKRESLKEQLRMDKDAITIYSQLPENIVEYVVISGPIHYFDIFVNDEEARNILLEASEEVPYFNTNDVDILFAKNEQTYDERLSSLKEARTMDRLDWNENAKKEISAFISKNHNFYNDTIMYGKFRGEVDMQAQVKHAEKALKNLKEMFSLIDKQINKFDLLGLVVKDEAAPFHPKGLKKDFKEIESLLEKAIQTQHTNELLYVHNKFHSMDIVFNEYESDDKYFKTFYEVGYNIGY